MAQNQAVESPGAFIKLADGTLSKVGPTHVGPTAPNSTPAGTAGNSVGEGWLDTSVTPNVLKVWNGGSWVAAVTPAAVPAATETVSGIAQLATQAEVDAGTNATDIVTPAKLRAASLGPLAKHSDVVDTAATTGQALTWNGTAWAPASASASAAASETVAGIAQLATQAEVDAGTNATDIVTPAKLRAATLGVLSKHSDVVDTAATTGQALTWNGTAWAPAAVVVPAASETVSGIAQLATQAEVDAGTNATDIVTPAKLRAATLGVLSKHSDVATTAPASGQTLSWNGTAWAPATQPANPVQATTTVAGIAQLATQAEVDAGTNATDIVTPATLRAATLGVLSKHSDVATTAPTAGQTLSWNGTVWAPATQPANPVQATTTVAGIAQLATQAEVNAGTVTTDIVTPATLKLTTVFDPRYLRGTTSIVNGTDGGRVNTLQAGKDGEQAISSVSIYGTTNSTGNFVGSYTGFSVAPNIVATPVVQVDALAFSCYLVTVTATTFQGKIMYLETANPSGGWKNFVGWVYINIHARLTTPFRSDEDFQLRSDEDFQPPIVQMEDFSYLAPDPVPDPNFKLYVPGAPEG
jgi:hypothetical protein